MKTFFAFLVVLVPFFATGQCHPEMNGTLRVEVNGNQAVLYNDTAWRTCDSQYEMQVRLVNGDTLKWVQIDQQGLANCLCHFNYSVTIDSLPPRLYFAKVYYSRHFQYDTCYIGTVRFRITAPASFTTPVVVDNYQSPCFPVWVGTGEQVPGITLRLFPNPTTGMIKVLTGLPGPKRITISDLQNRSVFELETDQPEITIDVSHLPKQMYFVTVSNRETNLHARFVKS